MNSKYFLNHGLFQPYSQENTELTGRYAGPGLGLAITKSLVELMHGRIEVESEQGVSLFKRSDFYAFDAILMDIRMPNMDGLKAAQNIRVLARPDAKTVPIIAMTANAFEEDKEETRKAGMNEHLAKPVVPNVLYETLERFMA